MVPMSGGVPSTGGGGAGGLLALLAALGSMGGAQQAPQGIPGTPPFNPNAPDPGSTGQQQMPKGLDLLTLMQLMQQQQQGRTAVPAMGAPTLGQPTTTMSAAPGGYIPSPSAQGMRVARSSNGYTAPFNRTDFKPVFRRGEINPSDDALLRHPNGAPVYYNTRLGRNETQQEFELRNAKEKREEVGQRAHAHERLLELLQRPQLLRGVAR